MKILVTGATGFLGLHLLDRLCALGHADQVRVLARASSPRLAALGVEVVTGSITSARDVERAVAGISHVYHLAGMVSRKASEAHLMHEVHVGGTRVLCRAAVAAACKRILLVSTSGTVAVARGADEMPDETCPAPVDIMGRWAYYASKLYQEQTARTECGDAVELVTVNPSLLLGPGDDRLSSTRDVLSFLSRDVPVIPAGGLNFVDARDVAAVLPAAMDKGVPGERYLLGGHNLSFREFFGRLERITKIQGPVIRGRGRWPYFASRVQAAIYKGLGRTPPIEPESVEMGEYFWFFSSSKAERALGFSAREASATLFDTVAYLRANVLGQAPSS